MHKKIYVAPCNKVIDLETIEMLASSNENSFDVSDKITDDDAVMSNTDRGKGAGNIWEQGWQSLFDTFCIIKKGTVP